MRTSAAASNVIPFPVRPRITTPPTDTRQAVIDLFAEMMASGVSKKPRPSNLAKIDRATKRLHAAASAALCATVATRRASGLEPL